MGTLRTSLRAVEWPDNELSVFAVLRGSLYSVLHDTLVKFRNAHERFYPLSQCGFRKYSRDTKTKAKA